jgi:hypothetical protein
MQKLPTLQPSGKAELTPDQVAELSDEVRALDVSMEVL